LAESKPYSVVASEEKYKGFFRVVTDQVTMPDGQVRPRDTVYKFSAVGVVAIDGEGQVILIRQYRHPVRRFLWELPAGLLDVEGEDPAKSALRELAEETDLTADRIDHLFDLHLSPGFTDEAIHLFLARDLRELPEDGRHQREAEEADIEVRRFPLAEAVDMIFRGEITKADAVAGLLAAQRVIG
jgi:8-oxo-dGTP pyrophosphatase MutT (NUDIX family)